MKRYEVQYVDTEFIKKKHLVEWQVLFRTWTLKGAIRIMERPGGAPTFVRRVFDTKTGKPVA